MTLLGNNTRQWFVMRDLRRSNAHDTAYRLLMKEGMEAFTPMTLTKNKDTGKKELVPIIHWLLFIHATKKEIDGVIGDPCPKIPKLQYCYERGKSARYGGMVVSDSAMNYFRMALAKQQIPVVYRYTDITPDMRGRRVLVTRGDMMGYCGHIQKYTGGRNMRLFVELENFFLAPIQISPEDVQFLDEKPKQDEDMHYRRLARMVDVINYLRFSLPQDVKLMDDALLAQVHQAYTMAETLFDEYRVQEYLCVDEVCRDKLAEISHELQKRPQQATEDESPLVARMQQLCQMAMQGQ